MLHSVEKIEELLGERVCVNAGPNHTEGVGSCEAPRGALFYHYQLDATSQKNLVINKTVEQTPAASSTPAASPQASKPPSAATTLAVVSRRTRLGQMPLVVELRDHSGRCWTASPGSGRFTEKSDGTSHG